MTSQVDDIDSRLVKAVRSGDREAFTEIYRRNHAAAYDLSCRLLGTTQGADTLVAEAFVKAFVRITAGGGPTSMFRAYLLTTVRTTFYTQVTRDSVVGQHVEDTEGVLPVDGCDPVTDNLETRLAMKALASMPERWRTVLVLLELERLTTSAIADLLGLRANADAGLAFRTLDALRVAYVRVYVKAAAEGVCREAVNDLAALLCGRLGRARRHRVREHLQACEGCSDAAREVSDLLGQLARTVPLTTRLAA